jgi:FecR protein
MKKFLPIFAAIFSLTAAGAVRAQSGPPPQDDIQMQQQPSDDDAAQQDNNQTENQAADQTYDSIAARQQQQHDAAAQPGVARVSSIRGDVSTQRGNNGEWVAATQNTPIAVGDRIATGEKSRAELQLDFADTLRMSDRVTVKIANLTRSQIQLQIGQGLTTYSVSRGAEAATEIDTPNAAIRPIAGDGEYRILVNSDAETQVIVRRGSAEISTPQGTTRVDAGQMITIAGTDNPQYKVAQAPPRDEWDNWNNDRNRAVTNADSWQKTNRYYVGSEDLDQYGRWTTVPDYGQVWVPSVGANWAPYRAGRWVWQPYFGWTWVSYEAWGWAPYHYGRWLPYGGGWAWWPGPVAAYPAYYPVWSPAYVSFFGFGSGGFGVGFGFGFGFGHVGWLPCGPGDWYHPWYGRYGGRVNVVNIHNTTVNNFHNGWAPLRGGAHGYSNVNAAFQNSHVRAGMSSMDSRNFGRGAVPSHQSGISESEFRNSSRVAGKMPIAPSKASYSPTNRAANPATIHSAASSSQHFYSAQRANSNSTAQSSRPAQENSNQHSSYGNNARSAQPNMNGNRNAVTGTQSHNSTPTPATGANRGATPTSTARGGWHTFTPPSSASTNRQAPNAQPNAHSSASNQPNRGGFQSSNGTQRQSQPQFSQPQAQSPAAQRPYQQPAHQQSQPQFSQRQSQPSAAQRPYQPQTSQRQYQAQSSAPRGGTYGSAARPPLNMRQPIVTPRSGGSNGGYRGSGSSGGGYRGGGSRGGGGGGSHKH